MNDNYITIWDSDEQNSFFLDHVIGKTVVDVKTDNCENICFLFDDGSAIRMYHEQECCEDVSIEDINGDLNDLIGAHILSAELRTNSDCGGKDEYDDSYTWSFYTFRTIKCSVDIRWYGSSNGYYSETIDIDYYPAGIEKTAGWDKKLF